MPLPREQYGLWQAVSLFRTLAASDRPLFCCTAPAVTRTIITSFHGLPGTAIGPGSMRQRSWHRSNFNVVRGVFHDLELAGLLAHGTDRLCPSDCGNPGPHRLALGGRLSRCSGVGQLLGGALAGLSACHEARLSAAVLSAPGLDLNVFLSAAKQVVWGGLREELLKQQPACDALNQTVLNLATTRPCIPKDGILLIEAIHDLWVQRESMEALWQAWGQPDIWRLPHSHSSRSLVPGLAGRVPCWLAPRLENLTVERRPTSRLHRMRG